MKLITTRDRIRSVAAFWKKQYWRGGRWTHSERVNRQAIYEKLCELNTNDASVQDVERIIGNASWTNLECNECNELVGAAVEVGDGYGASVCLCEMCLKHALGMTEEP